MATNAKTIWPNWHQLYASRWQASRATHCQWRRGWVLIHRPKFLIPKAVIHDSYEWEKLWLLTFQTGFFQVRKLPLEWCHPLPLVFPSSMLTVLEESLGGERKQAFTDHQLYASHCEMLMIIWKITSMTFTKWQIKINNIHNNSLIVKKPIFLDRFT